MITISGRNNLKEEQFIKVHSYRGVSVCHGAESMAGKAAAFIVEELDVAVHIIADQETKWLETVTKL